MNSHNYLTNGAWNAETSIVFHFLEIDRRKRGSVIVRQNLIRDFLAPLCVYVCLFCLYIRVLALNEKT